MMRFKIWIFVVSIIIFLGWYAYRYSDNSPTSLLKSENIIEVFSEKIPGSKFHSPDATWWGYNQNKIVRSSDYVFMYVIDNFDDKNTTLSDFVLYKKKGNNSWEKGASFPTSRPGNILIDLNGVLHAFVFEPTDVVKNDSWGRLIHYWFPKSSTGDIETYKKEIVVDNDGKIETANIRVGSAIGKDDTMAIGFGLTTFNPLYQGHSLHLYIKKPLDTKWTHLIAGENLGHDWYYPFIWVSDNREFHLLPVQDDYNGPGTSGIPYPNIYQKIMYFNFVNGRWQKNLIADLSTNPLAKDRPRLLEQEELFEDHKGKIHILYKEFLDPTTNWKTTAHKHLTKDESGIQTEQIELGKDDINWIRMFEAENILYYLYVFRDQAYIRKNGSEKLVKINIPSDAKGMYPYIATSRNGTKDTEKYIDILFLSADMYDYEKGVNTNYYIRIPKTELSKIKN